MQNQELPNATAVTTSPEFSVIYPVIQTGYYYPNWLL